jgi:hypothetical protein
MCSFLDIQLNGWTPDVETIAIATWKALQKIEKRKCGNSGIGAGECHLCPKYMINTGLCNHWTPQKKKHQDSWKITPGGTWQVDPSNIWIVIQLPEKIQLTTLDGESDTAIKIVELIPKYYFEAKIIKELQDYIMSRKWESIPSRLKQNDNNSQEN